VIFHAREAYEDLFTIAGEFPGLRRAVLHCFSGSRDVLARALDRGWHISFTCTITYKNAQALREVAGDAPLEKIMVETDAPFLAPQRVRGTRGEPAFVVDAAQALAGLKKVSLEEFARVTTGTACDFFNIPNPYRTTL
jgi:TatD DNase family protein